MIQSPSDDKSILVQYAKTGTWAERTNSLLRSFFAETGGNYIDIGANIGLTTIRRLAMFVRRQRLSLELSSGNLGDHRLRIGEKTGQYGEERRVTIDVEAVLDEIAGNLNGRLAVKIDTQGAEPLVISGG